MMVSSESFTLVSVRGTGDWWHWQAYHMCLSTQLHHLPRDGHQGSQQRRADEARSPAHDKGHDQRPRDEGEEEREETGVPTPVLLEA